MVTHLRDARLRANSLIAAFLAACAVISAYAGTKLAGTKTGLVLSLGAVIGPALLYVAIVYPLTFPFGLYALLTPFDNLLAVGSFGTLTKFAGLASGGALLLYMLRTRRFGDPHRNLVIWVLFYLWITASGLWAIDQQQSFAMLATAVQLLVLYVIVAMMPMSLRTLRPVLASVLLGGVLAAAYGVYMYHSGAGVFGNRLWIRTDDSAWNPDQFAAALLLPIGIAVYAILWNRNVLVRLCALGAFAVMVIALFLTGARGPELGLLAMMLYIVWFDRRRWQLVAISLPAVAVGALFAGPSFMQRWAMAGQNGGAGRTDIWRVGWLAFKQNWLFGAGYGNFSLAYDRAFMGVFQPLFVSWGRASHNILLGNAVELGVIGLALLLLAWWGQFRLLRDIPPTDDLYPLRVILESSLIALFICGIFADIMIEKYPWLAFMVVALARNAAVSHRATAPVNADA